MLTRDIALFLLAAAVGMAQTTVIKTTTLIDGKGHVLHNQDITIENGRITRIAASSRSKAGIDLSGLTVMPGWIDTHVHPTLVLQ